jgi:type II secretory pathway pseudopilin PulG
MSLVDLVVTVLIIGILTAAAAPRLAGSVSRHRVEAAARRVAADLKYARTHARIKNRAETVSFDAAGDRYSLSTASLTGRPSKPYAVALRDDFRVDLVSADFAGTAAVTFNAYAVPSTGGAVVVTAGSHQRTIRVAADSGDVFLPVRPYGQAPIRLLV